MIFCTACAAPIEPHGTHCPQCRAAVDPLPEAVPDSAPLSHRSSLSRALRLAPLLLLFAIGGALIESELSERAWLDSAYAAADLAEDAGDLVGARAAFAAIPGHRDASQRADRLSALLAPQEAGYAAGREAMQRGDYAAAVELLAPVAAAAPTLGDVTVDLDDARRLLALDLRREVDAALTIRDWTAAEHTLRELAELDPADRAVRAELALLQRDHGPLLVGYNRELWLMSPEGSRERQLAPDHQVIWPTWSPDRSHIAFLSPERSDPAGNLAMFLVSVDGAPPRRLGAGISGHAAPVWSPDGTRIAYTSFAGFDPMQESGAISVRVVEVETGVEHDLTSGQFALAFNPAWAPDSQHLAFTAKDISGDGRPQHAPGDIYVYDWEHGQISDLTRGRVDDVWGAAWSPAGDRLLLFSLFGQTWYEPPTTAVRLLDVGRDSLTVIAGLDRHASMPVWSPDGTRFAFVADDNLVTVIATNGVVSETAATSTLSGDLTWSPDGSALLATPWDVAGKSVVLNLSGDTPDARELDLRFDSNPPFVAPPQWAPAAPVPPAENLSLPARPVAATSAQ